MRLTANRLIRLPSKAIPRLIPVWRKAFMVAEAMPACGWGAAFITIMPVAGTARPMPAPSISRAPIDLEKQLAERFATRVELAQGRGGRGKLVIHYHSHDELDGILGKFK